jgi:hypothetical protein
VSRRRTRRRLTRSLTIFRWKGWRTARLTIQYIFDLMVNRSKLTGFVDFELCAGSRRARFASEANLNG